jgi:hypothetical protein
MATMPAINRYQQPIYDRHKRVLPMKKRDLTEVIEKVRKLQQLTKQTGFHTSRSVADLLRDCTPDELVEVYDALNMQR